MTETELLRTLPDQLKSSGVSEKLVREIPAGYSQTRAVKALDEFWKTDERTLVLLGGKGCGKSLAACSAIAANRVDNSKRGYLVSHGDMPPWWVWRSSRFILAAEMARMNGLSDDDKHSRHRLSSVGLLIIDEAGREDGDAERAIGAVLSERIDAEKRTIVTGNLSTETFRQRYGGRLVSRIEGSGRIVDVHGKDLRQPHRPGTPPDVTGEWTNS